MMKMILFIGSTVAIGFLKNYAVLSGRKLLGYKEFILSKKGREGELISSIFCLAIWLFIFCYDHFNSVITIIDSEFVSLFLGCMCGISISTIYTLKFMPKGFYEKGILTETKAISYKNISRVSNTATNNKKIIKYVFHLKDGKSLNLYVHEQDKEKMSENCKKHKLKG